MADFQTYQDYDTWSVIWPPERGQPVAPVRIGINRLTGKMLTGWPHVVQSIHVLLSTRFHERELREWVGSFVPHILGDNLTPTVITRFFWAIASAIDLWEPCYKIQRVVPYPILAGGDRGDYVDAYRRGEITFQLFGVYMPRGHLGDKTPETVRSVLVGRDSNGKWETYSPP